MRDETLYGGALILSAVGMIATGAFHPTGHQLLASPEAIAHVGLMNKIVHGMALGSVWLSFFGVVGLSRRLGLQRLDVTAALVAFAMGVMALTCAAVTDGIVATELAKGFIGADEATRNSVLQLLRLCGLIASSMSRFDVAAVSVAMLFWSVAMMRTGFSRALSWAGVIIGVVGLLALFSGHLRMNVHDLIAMVLGQGIWTVWTGVVMIRHRES